MSTLYIVTVRLHASPRVRRFAVNANTHLQAIDKVMKHSPELTGYQCEVVEIIEGVIQI